MKLFRSLMLTGCLTLALVVTGCHKQEQEKPVDPMQVMDKVIAAEKGKGREYTYNMDAGFDSGNDPKDKGVYHVNIKVEETPKPKAAHYKGTNEFVTPAVKGSAQKEPFEWYVADGKLYADKKQVQDSEGSDWIKQVTLANIAEKNKGLYKTVGPELVTAKEIDGNIIIEVNSRKMDDKKRKNLFAKLDEKTEQKNTTQAFINRVVVDAKTFLIKELEYQLDKEKTKSHIQVTNVKEYTGTIKLPAGVKTK